MLSIYLSIYTHTHTHTHTHTNTNVYLFIYLSIYIRLPVAITRPLESPRCRHWLDVVPEVPTKKKTPKMSQQLSHTFPAMRSFMWDRIDRDLIRPHSSMS